MQELREGELRVEQPQVNPEQAIEARHLELVQRHVDGADAGSLQVHGDLPQLHALVAERLETAQDLLGSDFMM